MLLRATHAIGLLFLGALASSLTLGSNVLAQQPYLPSTPPMDVRMTKNGVLVGRVVTEDGDGLEKQTVTAQQVGGKAVETVSDELGCFSIPGLKPGAYLVGVGERHVLCRVWTDQTAPPHFEQGVLVVAARPASSVQSRSWLGRAPGAGLFGGALRNVAQALPLTRQSD